MVVLAVRKGDDVAGVDHRVGLVMDAPARDGAAVFVGLRDETAEDVAAQEHGHLTLFLLFLVGAHAFGIIIRRQFEDFEFDEF